ncbi:hypothetical protein P8452_50550 [Trifolium repens]|nr:hypothetical protein P8452_50550 [Trifolium repens]
MRERGRERVRDGGSRALLGRPFRSPPSLEVRHKRGDHHDDSGEWTEVRNRRRKAPREGLRSHDSMHQNREYRDSAATSKPRILELIDHHVRDQFKNASFHNQNRNHRSLLGRNRSCDHVSIFNHRTRPFSCDSRRVSNHRAMESRYRSRSPSVTRCRQHASCLDVRNRSDVEKGRLVKFGRSRVFKQDDGFAVHVGHGVMKHDAAAGATGSNLKRFDRNASGAERRAEEGRHVLSKGAATRKEGYHSPATFIGGDSRIKGPDGVGITDMAKEGSEVQVGDVVIKLGNQKRRGALIEGPQNEKLAPKDPDIPGESAPGKESSILVRSYRSKSEDVQWAQKGLVATVINGEAIPVVQNRVIDAGFEDLVVTPMGADKRGAWVRLFIRADSCSAEKDRLDFARVLIATSDLAIVSRVERVLVDGAQVVIKIVEEWGYAMGEDTCLFEEESGSESSQADEDKRQGDPEASHNVELLVEKFTDVEKDVDGEVTQGQCGVQNPSMFIGDMEKGGGRTEVVGSPDRTVAALSPGEGSSAGSRVNQTPDSSQEVGPQASPTSRALDGKDMVGVTSQLRSSRAMSCPPSEDHRGWTGPWSWEWLRDHNHEEAWVIFSASKRARKGPETNSKKAGGVLRHPVHSLKKLARLPSKDRGEALKALGRCVRRRRVGGIVNSSSFAGCQASSDVSSASGPSDDDWRNWVAVHGNDEMALKDV